MTDTDPRQLLSDSDAIVQSAISTLVHAKRSIAIFSHDLPKAIYDDSSVLDALVKLANASRLASVRVIVSRPRMATTHAPKFLDLFRRLQSTMELRALNEEAGHHEETFIVSDETHVIYQPSETRWEATYAPDA
ncbi:MAG: hypothetical protein AAF438_15880, partial [Pseudomonadota bacterium]